MRFQLGAAVVVAALVVPLLASTPADAAVVHARAVGRFLDGAAGGKPIESMIDVHDARAQNPGSATDQNPLVVTLGAAQDVPLTGRLQAPGRGDAVHVGAANQVAKAMSDGYSYGASGAVANSGGASIGGDNDAYPADASLNLSPAAVPGSGTLGLPGAGGSAALGAITARVGAVSALATTASGGRHARTEYSIGSLELVLASPALGTALAKLGSMLRPPDFSGVAMLPTACSFRTQGLSTARIAGGAVTVDPTGGVITIDVAALLRTLGANLNSLPANTDLLGYVLRYLSSASGFGAGLQSALASTFTDQKAAFERCAQRLADNAGIGAPAARLITSLTSGQNQLQHAVNGAVAQLAGAGGADPFRPLTDGLKQAVQIGVNVQPHGPSGSYRSPLAATPDQATPVVAGQTVVRAVEVDLGGGQFSLALANAAAGPSAAEVRHVAHHTAPRPAPAVQHDRRVPTGVPAGQALPDHSPGIPLLLLAFAGLAAAGGAGAYGLSRLRTGRH